RHAALHDHAGNVSCTDDRTVTRFDVRIEKTLSGTVDLDVQALGGAVSLTGLLDISADVDFHILLGVDDDGFFVDANAFTAPELIVSNIRIGGEITGTGRFGFLEVTLSDVSLSVAPGVSLAVDLRDPGSAAADGLIRPEEFLGVSDPVGD